MAIKTTLENAHATIDKMKETFGELTSGSLKATFDAFATIATENHGEPFKTLPQTFNLTSEVDGHEYAEQYIVHAAWFRAKNQLDTFAAILFDPSTGKQAMLTNVDADWAKYKWLNDGLNHLMGTTNTSTH